MAESVGAGSRKTTTPMGCNLREGFRINNRYVIKSFLDGGGFGCVYLAEDLGVYNKPVVIKTLKEESLNDVTVFKKFKQEAEGLSRVDHDGVVKVLDQGELPEGNPFLVMEFVEGEKLRQLIPLKGMTLSLVADLVGQISSALSAAHKKGVFHRDLKPENIIVKEQDGGRARSKLIDFGIAKVANSLVTRDTRAAKHWGTPPYMSPEQLKGEEVTAASDVYALGVIVYELLTGDQLPKFNSPQELIQRQKSIRPDIPADAQRVILKAIEPDPNNRYQSASEFGEAMATALTKATASNKSELSTGLIAAAALVIVLIGLIVWWSTSKAKSPPVIRNVNSPPAAPSRASNNEINLRYYLTVQKMREGRPYQEPFQSSGQEVFENGYQFKFNLISPEPGYLYLFNEGKADDSKIYFNILYPTPKRNNGSAQIAANQRVVTADNNFGGQPDTEKFWIVWTKQLLPQLEAAKSSAFAGDGKIKDSAQEQRLRAFLQEQAVNKPEIVKDVAGKQTIIKGTSDVIVNLLYLEHR